VAILTLRGETEGASWQVWPNPDAVAPGAIHETGAYFFELRESPEAATADLLIDDRRLEALRAPRPDAAIWRWSPGFHAGTIEAELRLQGQPPQRFEFVTDPDRRKLTRADFDAMVREILEDTFALFSLSGFRTGVARGSGTRPPAIARLEFLRSRIDELEKVVADIARNPRRRLSAKETILPYHRAGRATGPEILRSFRSGRVVCETSSPPRLPEALKGFLPLNLRVAQRRSSLDIAEHRQMGACLRSWATWLAAVADILNRQLLDKKGDVKREAETWVRRIDSIQFAIWPPAASARRSLLAREFVGFLGSLIGRERVHELRVWADAAAVSPEMQRLPRTARGKRDDRRHRPRTHRRAGVACRP
jgi:hypothetical protein